MLHMYTCTVVICTVVICTVVYMYIAVIFGYLLQMLLLEVKNKEGKWPRDRLVVVNV